TLGGTITNSFGTFPGGTFTPVNTYTDLYGYVINIGVTPGSTGSWDDISPVLLSAALLDLNGNGGIDGVELVFDEPINDSTFIGAEDQWTFNGNPATGINTGTANDSTLIVLYATDNLGIDTSLSGTSIVFLNGASVEDLYGNNLAAIPDVTETDGAGPVPVNAYYTDVGINGVNAGDTIEITFSEPLNSVSGVVAGDIILPVTLDSLGGAGLNFALNGSNNLLITLGASPVLTVLGTYNGTTTAGSSSGININPTANILDGAAVPNNAATRTGTSNTPEGIDITDITPPAIISQETADLNGNGYIDAIYLTFNKPINDGTVIASEFDVSGVANEAFSSTTNGDTANDSDIYITFDDLVLSTAFSDVPTIEYSGSTLEDLTAMPLAPVGPLTCADGAGPAILTAEAFDNTPVAVGIDDGDTVVITFSEDVNNTGLINSGNIDTILNLSGHSWLDGSSSVGISWNSPTELLITLSTTGGAPTVIEGDFITLQTGSFQDSSGNGSGTDLTPTEITGSFTGAGLQPVITLVRACVGSNQLYVEFNIDVFTDTSANPIVAGDFYYDNTASGSGLSISNITSFDGSNRRFRFWLSGNSTARSIVNDRIRSDTNTSVFSTASVAMVSTVDYAVSDIGENFFTNVLLESTSQEGDINRVTVFNGSKNILKPNFIRVYADIFVNDPSYDALTPQLSYDVFDDIGSSDFWDPDSSSTDIVVNGTNVAGTRWVFTIPYDSRMKSGKYLSFVFRIGSLDCYRSKYSLSSSQFSPYYAGSYIVKIKGIQTQNSGVTILNNVINPHNGEKVKLIYNIEKAGPVSIVVYDLNSEAIMTLKIGNQHAGKYTVAWDGKNELGKIVTRGVYFIRVRAPGIFNQLRKVLVIK
ncbi:MAG: hypothetical protein JXB50_03385, partial [Spirochaetes bacterium]|nr:hypothetical protein [Spirochaetota bacterium]